MSFKCLQRKQEFDQRQKEMEISIGNAVPKQQKPKEAEEKTKQRVQKVNTFRKFIALLKEWFIKTCIFFSKIIF